MDSYEGSLSDQDIPAAVLAESNVTGRPIDCTWMIQLSPPYKVSTVLALPGGGVGRRGKGRGGDERRGEERGGRGRGGEWMVGEGRGVDCGGAWGGLCRSKHLDVPYDRGNRARNRFN